MTHDPGHEGSPQEDDHLVGADEVTFAPTRPVKRSFSIAGHRTSISLEAAFWDALRSIAGDQGRSLASLVAEIDRERGDAGLSGAIRVWILNFYRNERGGGVAKGDSNLTQ